MAEKARVTQISYAGLEFEGLMLPSGEYAMSLSQVIALFYDNTKMSIKTLKARTGLSFKSIQRGVKTELGKNKSIVIGLDDVVTLIQLMAKKGNQKAIGFAVASMAEKLERVFAKAFNQKFDEEKAEVKFQERMAHAMQFHPLYTSHLKIDNPCRKDYGTQVNKLKKAVNLPLVSIDQYDTEQLRIINNAEVAYNTLRNVGYDHEQALSNIDL